MKSFINTVSKQNPIAFQFKYRQYSKALYHALVDDPFYVTMEKSVSNDKESREAMLRYMEYSITEGKKYGELFIPNDHEYGVSIWSKPLEPKFKIKKKQEKQSFLLNNMGQKSLDTYNSIVKFMSEKTDQTINDNFWYLSIVGVLPAFQGKELGAGLIKKVLKRTDLKGVATYLETFTPQNMAFYERLGYHTKKSFYEPKVQAEYWLMVRECDKDQP